MNQTISQIIQRQASLGDIITLELKTGKEFTGVITEIGTDHITINRNEEIIIIVTDSISGWLVKRTSSQADEIRTLSIISNVSTPSPAHDQPFARAIQNLTGSERNVHSIPEFQEIENPYAAYAEGGIVSNPDMFFGRDELIANIAKTLQSSYHQSKCVIIYGQKRAGKSSILYHLKTRLQSNKDMLILDVGNIGSILDEQSNTPFLYQILWAILKKLAYAVEDEIERGRPEIKLDLPGDQAFFNYPSPLSLFKDVFERFRRTAAKLPEWRNVRLVLIIDEFSYIYQYIVRGLIPETFMKNWKALLQENYFHAVLAGQDVMPKFKQRFPNEFGTTQDERVTYLRREDAIKLIDEPIRIGGRPGESRYRERAIDRILDLTAGSPFYIQILCNRLVEYMNRKRASLVTEADVDQVKDELIKGVNALTLDKFDNLISSGDTSEDAISDDDALKVLAAIASHSKTGGPCNRNSIVCQTHTPLDTILEDLVKRDVIERVREQYYSLRVGLFKEWLIANQ